MTTEEHITRAMLLGLKYSRVNHVYYSEVHSTTGRSTYRDADTLEPMTIDDVLARISLEEYDIVPT